MRSTLFPLAATLAVQALVAMAVVTVPVLAPELAGATGLPAGYIGIFIAVVYAASMAASLVSGTLIQRYGARPVALSGRASTLHPLIAETMRAGLPGDCPFTLRPCQGHHAAARLALAAATA